MKHTASGILEAQDRQYIWHPYSAINSDLPVFAVRSAHDVYLQLEDGRQLIDGMSSWWCAIHGYKVRALDDAISKRRCGC